MPMEKYLLSLITPYNKHRRINRLDIKINDNKNNDFEDEYIIIAIDSTDQGFKQRSMDER
jgi:hypothetical protein